ncbi:MAG: hypothetical protein A3D21_05155 [Nitrospirae bacterium RIFCSPHIGHO2_02_FULL_42_12]|nr:MAG: hypothetical protein A3D21_05155 [Nitrospirae bacterium RIFCSPHIGHO2_02_FULL_42_12]
MLTEEQVLEQDDINLLDFLRVLIKRKIFIIAIVVITFISSTIYSLFLPDMFVATSIILPPQYEGSSGNINPSQFGNLGGFVTGILNINSPTDLWLAILKSQTLKEAIVSRLNLINAFRVKTKEEAASKLNGMVEISKTREGLISISLENKDPELAATLANAFVEELDRTNKNMVMTSGRRMRFFVEERLKIARIEVDKAEETIRSFQERNKALKLDDQSRAVFEAVGTLKGQLLAKEVELQTLLSYATPNNPQAEILKTQIEELKEKIVELEEGKGLSTNPASKDIFIPTSKFPNLSLQYARLLRDTKVQQTLYELLIQQYEMARIQEAKDTPTVQVLDVAKVPEKSSKPNRKQIILVSTITAIFFSIFMIFFIEYLEKARKRSQL